MSRPVHQHLARMESAREAHRAVESQIAQMVALLERWHDDATDAETLTHAGEVVAQFRHHLTCHFAWEEGDGWMKSLLSSAPDRAGDIERLREDHRRFDQELDEIHQRLVQAAHGVSVEGIPSARRLRALIQDLRDHEGLEHALVSQVYYEAP